MRGPEQPRLSRHIPRPEAPALVLGGRQSPWWKRNSQWEGSVPDSSLSHWAATGAGREASLPTQVAQAGQSLKFPAGTSVAETDFLGSRGGQPPILLPWSMECPPHPPWLRKSPEQDVPSASHACHPVPVPHSGATCAERQLHRGAGRKVRGGNLWGQAWARCPDRPSLWWAPHPPPPQCFCPAERDTAWSLKSCACPPPT